MSIYGEIRAERDYQLGNWGSEADITVNTPNDFISYIAQYATRWRPGGFPPYTTEVVDDYRRHMIKVAALAVAATEALDNQRHADGHAFFEIEA